MNKQSALVDLTNRLKIVQGMIEAVNKIELGKVYKFEDTYYGISHGVYSKEVLKTDTYGYFETFSRESTRFVVIASDNPQYIGTRRGHRGNIKALNYVTLSEVYWKSQAFEGVEVSPLSNRLIPVKENELPLLIGMKFKSVEFEKILSRRKKLKYA